MRRRNTECWTSQRAGIPLGSITAQLASKSFWREDMLSECLKQIAHCVAKESAANGEDSRNKSLKQLQQIQHIYKREHSTETAEEDESMHSSVSADSILSDAEGYKTPPYLSPGAGRRATQLTIRNSLRIITGQ